MTAHYLKIDWENKDVFNNRRLWELYVLERVHSQIYLACHQRLLHPNKQQETTVV